MSDAQQPTSKSFHHHARLISALTLLSRVLGLAREAVAVHFLGTELVASAFSVAFAIPNLFRKLLGEGALAQAFIPLYAQARQRGETETGNTPEHFAASSVKLLVLILITLTVIGELIFGGFIAMTDPSRPDRRLMLEFGAVMLPYVLLVCGGAFLSAVLQVHHRFGAPAFAPVVLNVVHIAVVIGGAWWLGLHGRDDPNSPRVIALQTRLAFMLAVGVLAAGVLQVAVLLPALRAIGFRFTWKLPAWTPDTRKMLRLSIPVAMSAGVLQLSVLLDKAISYGLMQGQEKNNTLITHFAIGGHVVRYPMELGATRNLELAQLMYQFPLGIFAIAIATALYPAMSASAKDKDRTAFSLAVRQGTLATIWEGIPASVGLMLVADPAVRLLFQHGQTTAHHATMIIRDTIVYSSAIWAYSMLQVINRAYYALHDARTPLIASSINVVSNVAVELSLLWWLGEPAMAVGTAVSFSVQALVTLWLLDRRIEGMGLRHLARPTLKIIVATLLMLGACLAVRHLPIYPHQENRIAWLTQLVEITVCGGVVYLIACRVLGVGMTGLRKSRSV